MLAHPIRTIIASLLLLAPAAGAQPANDAAANPPGSTPDFVTLLTHPPGARIRVDGEASFRGRAPVDLPSWMIGRHSVVVEGPGISRTQGVLFLPEGAGRGPILVSETPGLSAGLLVRSLNYPGVPDLTARRPVRGLALATAATGAAFAATRAHLRYRDRLKEFGGYAADRARDERHERNAWFTYGLAVWGTSAVDYWIRPRFGLQESDPTHALLAVPPVTRAGVAWRSLIVPGAGQEFGNHSARGTLWLSAFLAAGAGFTLADGEVERNQTKLDWARTLVDSAGPSERPLRLRDVEVRKNDLQSSEDIRRGFRYAVVGVYVANVIDALVMPLRGPEPVEPPRVSAAFPVGPGHAGVALTYRF